MLGTFKISLEEDHLLMQAGIGDFVLLPVGKNEFHNEDIQIPFFFNEGEETKKGLFMPNLSEQRLIKHFNFFY